MTTVRRIISTSILLLLTVYMYTNMYDILCVKEVNAYLLDSTGNCSYEFDTENTIYVNLSGVSNGVLEMCSNGFEVYRLQTGNDNIDIILQNTETDEVYRYYYKYPERRLTCFSNVYEKSYKGLTYIIK